MQPAEAGQAALELLVQRWQHSDRATWAQRLQAGECQLNGAPVQAEQVPSEVQLTVLLPCRFLIVIT